MSYGSPPGRSRNRALQSTQEVMRHGCYPFGRRVEAQSSIPCRSGFPSHCRGLPAGLWRMACRSSAIARNRFSGVRGQRLPLAQVALQSPRTRGWHDPANRDAASSNARVRMAGLFRTAHRRWLIRPIQAGIASPHATHGRRCLAAAEAGARLRPCHESGEGSPPNDHRFRPAPPNKGNLRR